MMSTLCDCNHVAKVLGMPPTFVFQSLIRGGEHDSTLGLMSISNPGFGSIDLPGISL